MTEGLPRPEYPRPQMVRDDWMNLNGSWQFETDPGDSGLERGMVERDLAGMITVPFCPESQLSGIADEDFHRSVWYRRSVEIPTSWTGRRVLLHFQAVDHDATVWVDGIEVGRHRGGFTPFTCDLGHRTGGISVVLRARDRKDGPQARGKQSVSYSNTGAHYARTTGIWQSVWCEPVPEAHVRRPKITPDVATGVFHVTTPLSSNPGGYRLRVKLQDGDEQIADAETTAGLDLSPTVALPVPTDRVRLWQPGDPHLYGLEIDLLDTNGAVVDRVTSYAGLRSVAIDGRIIRINGEPVFQRLVLDQGFYPDGIMTAPSDDALVRDIELARDAGFNGARLHQKVFEERYLYHADRLGYLVWGEFADWGANMGGPPGDNQQPTASFITQWLEAVERDYSHPSIVGWCPLNETRQEHHDRITALDDVTRGMFLAAKAADPTRPVLDTSGYSHRVPEADVYDSHSYEQEPDVFAQQMAGLAAHDPFVNTADNGAPWSVPYRGQPYFCSEFGGIWWAPDASGPSWGYGTRPASEEAYHERFAGLVETLLQDPEMFGYCYTQLTDVYQEQNGIYNFDRTRKLDVNRIRSVQKQPAAIEMRETARGDAETL